eukprot:scaffold216990_cov28-Tisochrysis_lutea.AAC.3
MEPATMSSGSTASRICKYAWRSSLSSSDSTGALASPCLVPSATGIYGTMTTRWPFVVRRSCRTSAHAPRRMPQSARKGSSACVK